MIITCPDCATRYDVDDERFTPSGRSVRCTSCGESWFVPAPEELDVAPIEDLSPAARVDEEEDENKPKRGRGRLKVRIEDEEPAKFKTKRPTKSKKAAAKAPAEEDDFADDDADFDDDEDDALFDTPQTVAKSTAKSAKSIENEGKKSKRGQGRQGR